MRVNGELLGTHGWAIKWAHPRALKSLLTPKLGMGAEKSLFEIAAKLFDIPQTEWSQIGEHRLSTSCVIIERPDRHCGDDLVQNYRCSIT